MPERHTYEPQQLEYKKQAAERAINFVESGMVVGLGTGSTAIFATRRLAELLRQGALRDILGFATSRATWEEARRLDIPLLAQEMPRDIDLTIDGADEVDPRLNVIKGGGGALLREKIVAQASRRVVITVDESKLSPCLGTHHPVPVEVLGFGWQSQARYLESLQAKITVRKNADGSEFATDSGNMILDCDFGAIADPAGLAEYMARRAGIVEHGLFLELATDVVIAGPAGIEHRTRPR
ncbi:MAG TPA: ribose-5-phosphate isomerase RpiA [Terriglobales bacterium]|nr:ribose-5-phosphate isomerase RpiA [Terriglobales bacterium]